MTFMNQLLAFVGLPQSKVILSIPERTETDGSYWYANMEQKSEGKEFMMCPWKGCDGTLLDGPSAGMCTNVKCDTCDRKWNHAMNTMERI